MFQLSRDNGLTIHWDGKIITKLTGSENVDRLPIVASQMGTEQLLNVPELPSRTGQAITQAVFKSINDWNLSKKVEAACFDTTNANTGWKNGAVALLEKLLRRSLLWLPCRHHIYEIIYFNLSTFQK